MTKTKTTETHTVETYWNAILGHSACPASIVAEYKLQGQTEKEIRTFLDESEQAAVREGLTSSAVPESVRKAVLKELVEAAS